MHNSSSRRQTEPATVHPFQVEYQSSKDRSRVSLLFFIFRSLFIDPKYQLESRLRRTGTRYVSSAHTRLEYASIIQLLPPIIIRSGWQFPRHLFFPSSPSSSSSSSPSAPRNPSIAPRPRLFINPRSVGSARAIVREEMLATDQSKQQEYYGSLLSLFTSPLSFFLSSSLHPPRWLIDFQRKLSITPVQGVGISALVRLSPLSFFCRKGRGEWIAIRRLEVSRNVARFKPSGGTLSERPCAGIASNVMNSILSFLPQLFLFFLFLCVFNHSSFFAARELRSDGGGLFESPSFC